MSFLIFGLIMLFVLVSLYALWAVLVYIDYKKSCRCKKQCGKKWLGECLCCKKYEEHEFYKEEK